MNSRIYWGVLCLSWLTSFGFSAEYEPIIPFLNKYCVSCHGPDEQEADIRLDDVRSIDGELWIDIFHQIDQGDMPPRKAEQPPADLKASIMKLITKVSYDDRFTISTGYRRLNKREYHNTVLDLLGLSDELFNPSGDIYPDELEDGFDTNAVNLEISNELLLEFLQSGEKSLRAALFTSETEKPQVNAVTYPATKLISTGQFHYRNKIDVGTMVRDGTITLKNGREAIQQTGMYRVSVKAAGKRRANLPKFKKPKPGEPFRMEIGVAYQGNSKMYETFAVKDDQYDIYEKELWLEKGAIPFVKFVNGQFKPRIIFRKIGKVPLPALSVSEIQIEGPLDVEWPPATYKTTFQIPDRVPDFENRVDRHLMLKNFVSRAYRRPVTDKELEGYMLYMHEKHGKTDNWREAVIHTFAAVMASNDFLYIKEDLGPLKPFQLASRLSYFLWSSMPDAELFRLANTGELTDPEVYKNQIRRMFFDPRTANFIEDFGSQWLSLTKLGSMRPDVGEKAYIDYYRLNLEDAMREETLLYIKHVLLQNRPIGEFLDSDYTFINKGLAKIYGLPFEGGAEHVLFKLPENSIRGGLLGHASIHAVTSNGVETLPVERGHWVLDELMGIPPPPPPKEVPALVADLSGLDTPRDQLARHSEDATCFKCHQQMDPAGLALETFDIIGRDRANYGRGKKIDTAGEFYGHQFDDVRGLRRILKSQEKIFADSLVTKIAEYAKGRKLNRKDKDTVTEIVNGAFAYDYRFMNLIRDILVSDLILHR